jgi:hypothetical protein
MPLTHHPVRLFRLSCGCLREYPVMPSGTAHIVLCITCRVAARTLLAYPERCCGVTGWADVREIRVRVSCTRGTGECAAGLHLDEIAGAEFPAGTPRLARSREGKTGRA